MYFDFLDPHMIAMACYNTNKTEAASDRDISFSLSHNFHISHNFP